MSTVLLQERVQKMQSLEKQKQQTVNNNQNTGKATSIMLVSILMRLSAEEFILSAVLRWCIQMGASLLSLSKALSISEQKIYFAQRINFI